MIMFDRRGTGLSDRVREVPNLETRMDDIRAVLDDLDVEQAAFWTAQDGSRLALLFAATYPERTTALTLYQPIARGVWAEDYPWAKTEDDWRRELREAEARWGERAYLVERLHRHVPTVADDPAFQDWFVRYMRRSASPGSAAAFLRMEMEGDVRDVLASVRAPTLVVHGPARADEARYIAHSIPDAEVIEIDGLRDDYSWANPEANDVFLDETSRFLERLRTAPGAGSRAGHRAVHRHRRLHRAGGRARRPALAASCSNAITRSCAASSTAVAGGGGHGRRRLPRHLRRPGARHPLCVCDSGRGARRSASSVRAGLHTGECELVDGKVAGIAVNRRAGRGARRRRARCWSRAR